MTLGLAWAQVRPSLGRLAVAIVAIALGVALAAAMLLANQALYESLSQSIKALAGRAELQVIARSGGDFDERVLDLVRSVQGVRAAAPLVVGTAFLGGREGEVVRIVGVDMLDEATAEVYGGDPGARAGIQDPLLLLSQPDSALVTESFAREHALRLGDAIEVDALPGRRRLRIRGLLPEGDHGQAFAASLVVMDLPSAQDVLGATGRLSQLDILLVPGAEPREVAAKVASVLPAHLQATDSASRQATLNRTLSGFQQMLDAMGLLGLVLATLIVANRLSTIYQSRLWELGVMRALGASPRRLLFDLLAEAVLIAALGALLAMPLSLVLAQLVVQPVSNTLALNFKESFSIPAVSFRARPLALAAAAGILGGLLAALGPARKAVRLCVVAVLVQARGGARAKGWTAWMTGPLQAIAVGALVVLALTQWRAAVLGLLALAPVAAYLCIGPSMRALGARIARLLGPAAEIGAASQARLRGRTTGAASVLMGGVAMLVWVASTAQSFERHVVSVLMGPRQADLVVQSARNESHVGDIVRFSEAALTEIAAIPGVALAAGESYMLSAKDQTGVLGVDPARFERSEFGAWKLAPGALPDALGRVARGEAAFASAALVARHGIRVGDILRVTTPSGLLELPLAAIVEAAFVSPAGDAIVSRSILRRHWPDAQVRHVYVLVKQGASLAAVRSEISKRVGERYGLQVMSSDDLGRFYAQTVRRGFSFLDALGWLTLVVVLLGTGDALAAEVLERGRELGTMRAVGASRRHVAAIVLGQALSVGIVGGALGLPVGFALSYAYVTGVVPGTLGWQLAYEPELSSALAATGLGLFACLLGSIVPALRATRLPPLAALRYE